MTPQSFPFSKNRYFPHKRMRSSDFIREQAYVEQKLAFLSRWDFGAGVALGLEVLRMDGDSLLVSPGFAVDGYGRWLIVDEPAICRIRTLHGFDALHGETALLWLAYHEEHTDPMFVPGDQGEVREYAAARERFSFYLTDMRLLPEAVGRSTLFSDVILFEDEDLRIRQVIPQILPGHGLVQIRLIVESFRAEPLDIALRYSPELPSIQAADSGRPLGFDQSIRLGAGETTLTLTGKLDTTAQAVLPVFTGKGIPAGKAGPSAAGAMPFSGGVPRCFRRSSCRAGTAAFVSGPAGAVERRRRGYSPCRNPPAALRRSDNAGQRFPSGPKPPRCAALPERTAIGVRRVFPRSAPSGAARGGRFGAGCCYIRASAADGDRDGYIECRASSARG